MIRSQKMPGLDELYREVILDHYRDPAGSEEIPAPTLEAEGFNPLCGDELVLRLLVEDGRIRKVQVTPKGCSISVSSASMLAQQLAGRTLAEAVELKRAFRNVLHGEPWPEDVDLGDLEALEGVRNFPVRIKCALLAWMTLEQALSDYDTELVGDVEEDEDIEVRTR